MKPTPRHIDVAALVLVVLILVSAGGCGTRMIMDARQKRAQQQLLTASYTDQKRRAESDLVGLETMLAQRQDVLARMARRIPKTADIGAMLCTVQDLAGQRDVALTDFSHGEPQRVGRYRQVALQLRLAGRFPDMYRLIHDLETQNRLLVIDSLQIRQGGSDSCAAVISASIFFEG